MYHCIYIYIYMSIERERHSLGGVPFLVGGLVLGVRFAVELGISCVSFELNSKSRQTHSTEMLLLGFSRKGG